MDEDRIIQKIQNLLNKTVENGATIDEAKTALKLANKLMIQYAIDSFKLNRKKQSDIIQTNVTIQYKNECIPVMYSRLAKLFDTVFYSIPPFYCYAGYKLDIRLVLYFHYFIENTLENNVQKYKTSSDYEHLNCFYKPTTIINSYIKGFCYTLYKRLEELIQDKVIMIKCSTGTNLVQLKTDSIYKYLENEFNLNIGQDALPITPDCKESYELGATDAENVCLYMPLTMEEKYNEN